MSALSAGQVTEIKKVFAVFNQSGSNRLSVEELSTALERISGSKPSFDEVQNLLSVFDKDNDGRVCFEEFCETISTFISSQQSGSSRLDKSDEFDKKQLHANIADFFLQYKKSANWNELQARRLQIASSIRSSLTEQEVLDQTKQQDQLQKCQSMCSKLPDIVSSLHQAVGANDIGKATNCVQFLADILSILNVYQTLQDRLVIAEFLATLFRRVRDSNVAKKIIEFLSESEAPQLQYQSCRFIVHFCNGPRIPNTPINSTLHPSKMYYKSVCINNGAVQMLEALFASEQKLEGLRNKAIEAVGKIASYDGKAREYVINAGDITHKLLALIQPTTSTTTLRYVTWTLSIILGNTHTTEPANLDSKTLQTALEKLGQLLFEIVAAFRTDFEAQSKAPHNQQSQTGSMSSSMNRHRLSNEQKTELNLVLMNTLCCLSYLLPGIKNFPAFWSQFVQLVAFPIAEVQCMVLDCMKDIIDVDAGNHLDQMLSIGLLKALNTPFRSKEVGPRHKALGLLSSIVSIDGGKYVKPVISSGYVQPLLQLMSNDDLSRLTVVKIMRFITKNQQFTQQLVQQNSIIRELGSALNSFRKFDPIIREVYHFVGPTYNFEFIEDVIETLGNILRNGKTGNTGNLFIDKFDMQLLDRISDVVMKISTAKGIETWRNISGGSSLENRLVELLENIKYTHLQCDTKLATEVSQFVDSMIFNFRQSISQNRFANWQTPTNWGWHSTQVMSGTWSEYMNTDIQQKVRIKCCIQDGNNTALTLKTQVIDNVEKNINLGNLQYRLASFVGCPVRVYYKNKFGQKMFIAQQSDLDEAMANAVFNQLDLYLVPIAQTQNQTQNQFQSNSPNMALTQTNMNPGGGVAGRSFFSDSDVIRNFRQQYGLPFDLINTLWTSFRERAKDGTINKTDFVDIMRSKVGMNDYTQIEQLFSAFDHTKNGHLNFRELCTGFAILHRGSADDKMNFAFKSFDIDDDGKLMPAELFMMFKFFVTTKGIKYNTQDIDAWVKDVINKYDTTKKGHLNLAEFKHMVHRRPMLIQAFYQFGSSDQQSFIV